MNKPELRVLVFSSLFPNALNRNAGIFIKERLFRLAQRVPLEVVAPQVWSPIDPLLRLKWQGYRAPLEQHEIMDGVAVHRPRAFSVPVVLKTKDGDFMWRSITAFMDRLVERFRPSLIDAHFGYPDGYAAIRLGQRYNLPVLITLRGSKDANLIGTPREPLLRYALRQASAVISVSNDLKERVAIPLGVPAERCHLIGNGVDSVRFAKRDRSSARRTLGIAPESKVIISVGNLIEAKGFERLIRLMPELLKHEPKTKLLIVGGEVAGDPYAQQMKQLVSSLGLSQQVEFCGRVAPERMSLYYSAANVFALATRFEGWPNVFLEAMCSGLPVVSTKVGGNPEVVPDERFGTLVEFWDSEAALKALLFWINSDGHEPAIIDYARVSGWDQRVSQLERVMYQVLNDATTVKAA